MTDVDKKRAELQQLLDSIANHDNKIDAVFVFGCQKGKIIYFSKLTGYNKQFGGETTIKTFEGWLGRFKDTPQTLSQIQLGNIKYLIIPFDDGLLSLYFFEDKLLTSPVIIGFAYQGNDGESAMGEMSYNADVAVKKVKDLLRELSSLNITD